VDTVMLLGKLVEAGVELQPKGDVLRFRPRSAVTLDLLSEIEEHKQELIRLLRTGAQSSPPYNCSRCRRAVKLVLGDRGDMWNYRCSCGCRAKVACRDYDKLRAFDEMLGGAK